MSNEGAKALTDILRVGNPWLVGHNYGRVAPLFVLNSLLSSLEVPGASSRIEVFVQLLNSADPGRIPGSAVPIEHADHIAIAVRGALASDRRVFGAADFSSLLPVHRGIIRKASSDDMLGTRIRNLVARSKYGDQFHARLSDFFASERPDGAMGAVRDPVSRFVSLVVGPLPPDSKEQHADEASDPTTPFDAPLAEFILNCFSTRPSTQRIGALRSLGLGAYMAAIIRMLQGPVAGLTGKPQNVLVFTGMPPGKAQAPTTRAAIASLRSLVKRNWDATLAIAEHTLVSGSVAVGPGSGEVDLLRQRLAVLLGRERASKIGVQRYFRGQAEPGAQGLRSFVEDELGGGSEVLLQRIRSLSSKIGFAAPDRGTGGVRLTLDTPLLTVLTDGLLGKRSMEFSEFVTRARTHLGLVIGLGSDDSFVDAMEDELLGYGGPNLYDVLYANEEALRQRLLRTGLARTYSDAHTEVIPSDA